MVVYVVELVSWTDHRTIMFITSSREKAYEEKGKFVEKSWSKNYKYILVTAMVVIGGEED